MKAGLTHELTPNIEHKTMVKTWFYTMFRKFIVVSNSEATNYDPHVDFIEMNDAKEKLLKFPFFIILNV